MLSLPLRSKEYRLQTSLSAEEESVDTLFQTVGSIGNASGHLAWRYLPVGSCIVEHGRQAVCQGKWWKECWSLSSWSRPWVLQIRMYHSEVKTCISRASVQLWWSRYFRRCLQARAQTSIQDSRLKWYFGACRPAWKAQKTADSRHSKTRRPKCISSVNSNG